MRRQNQYQQPQVPGYTSMFVPQDLSVMQGNLQDSQKRYDQSNQAWAQTKAALINDPTYDPQAKKEIIDSVEKNFGEIYKSYNGDLGQGQNDLLQLIAGSRNNPYFELNRKALENQKRYQKLVDEHGTTGIEEFGSMAKSLRDENGKWVSEKDLDFDAEARLARPEKRLALWKSVLGDESWESGIGPDGISITRKGIGEDQIKGKVDGVLNEYMNTAEGKQDERAIERDLGYKRGSKESKDELRRRVLDSGMNFRNPGRSVEYSAGYAKDHDGSGNTTKPTGPTFTSIGETLGQHPDLSGITGHEDLADKLAENPNSPALNKLNLKVTSSPAYQAVQKDLSDKALTVWSGVKAIFPKQADLKLFPELNKLYNKSGSVVNTDLLNDELIRLGDAIYSGNFKEATKVSDIKAKKLASSAISDLPFAGSSIPGAITTLESAVDKVSTWFRSGVAENIGTSTYINPARIYEEKTNPALKEIMGLIKSTSKLKKASDDVVKSQFNMPGKSVTVYTADELNATGPQQQMNKEFNAALPKYLSKAITDGLLVDNTGKVVEGFEELPNSGAIGNVSPFYNKDAGIGFVVDGVTKEGKVEKRSFTFTPQGQSSDIAQNMIKQLDNYSRGKISKLQSSTLEPVEGTSYLLNTKDNSKVSLPKGFSISEQTTDNGFILKKGGKDVTFLDASGAKTTDQKIFVYLTNLKGYSPEEARAMVAKATKEDKEASIAEVEKLLSTIPVTFETGEDLMDFVKSGK
jgi:hypothetical protein